MTKSIRVEIHGGAGESSQRAEASVGEVMHRQSRTAEEREMLEPALARLRECECDTPPVTENSRIFGLLTMNNVGEFVLLQAALRGRRATRPARRQPQPWE